MKLRYLIIPLIALLPVLVITDKFTHKIVTASLTKKGSVVDQRFDSEVIDWDGPDLQYCEFSYLWWLFPYQTCYARSANPDAEYFVYRLTGPPQFFSLRFGLLGGRTQESYRFTLPVVTDARYLIYPDGTIEDVRDIPYQ